MLPIFWRLIGFKKRPPEIHKKYVTGIHKRVALFKNSIYVSSTRFESGGLSKQSKKIKKRIALREATKVVF